MKTKRSRPIGDVRDDGYVFQGMGTTATGASYERWLQPHLYQRQRVKHLYYACRRRAKAKGVPFNLDAEHLQHLYPKDGLCPVLGTPLCWGTRDNKDASPSVDRIVPERGYVNDNVAIISHRANQLKSDATLSEMEKVVSYLTNCPRAPSTNGRD